MNVQLTVWDCDEAIKRITADLQKCKNTDSRSYERLYKLRDSYLTQRYLLMEEQNGCVGISADE